MLSLYLLRHAKAEDSAPAGGDRARALKGRGRKAAQLMGKFLARLEEPPGLVLCSPAVRARDTAELARAAGGFRAPIELRPAIYEASPDTLLAEVRSAPAGTERVLLVGHQPGLSLLIALLTGGEPEFPTAALARLDFDLAAWSEVRPRSGQLAWQVTPEVIGAMPTKSAKH